MLGGIRKSSNVIASHLSLGMDVRSKIVYFPIAHIHSQQWNILNSLKLMESSNGVYHVVLPQFIQSIGMM